MDPVLNQADTPLLLIAWRLPDTLRQVIDAIRPVAPTRLFVACDGPNPDRPGEAEKVAATRAVIHSEIDWPCQIERSYSNTNQGCRLGVSRPSAGSSSRWRRASSAPGNQPRIDAAFVLR